MSQPVTRCDTPRLQPPHLNQILSVVTSACLHIDPIYTSSHRAVVLPHTVFLWRSFRHHSIQWCMCLKRGCLKKKLICEQIEFGPPTCTDVHYVYTDRISPFSVRVQAGIEKQQCRRAPAAPGVCKIESEFSFLAWVYLLRDNFMTAGYFIETKPDTTWLTNPQIDMNLL